MQDILEYLRDYYYICCTCNGNLTISVYEICECCNQLVEKTINCPHCEGTGLELPQFKKWWTEYKKENDLISIRKGS